MSLSQTIRKSAMGVLRHTPALRQTARKVYYALRSRRWEKLAKATPTQPHTILFECFGGRQFGCSPRSLYEQVLSDPRFSDYRLIWAFTEADLKEHQNHPLIKGRAEVITRGTPAYFEACAQAKYWIFNTRVAEYVTPKPDQVYVQCWHGTPLKRLGYDVVIETQAALNTSTELANRFGLDAQKWDYLLSPSAYTSLHLADAFGLPQERRASVVLEEGYPRNDRIVRTCSDEAKLAEAIASFRTQMGIEPGKKMLLYAPTWRDDAYQSGLGYVMEDMLLDLAALRERIGDEWVVLFRAHYYIANSFDFSAHEGFVYNVSDFPDINDLYIVADALLTDYSSVFFDYANTGRPIMFFWPDYEHYANDIRGFYFDISELPGPHCMTTEEVAQAVSDIAEYDQRYGEGYRAFRDTFCYLDDGYAAQRVAEKVFFGSR